MSPATAEDDFLKVKALLAPPASSAEHVLRLSEGAPADRLERIRDALVDRAPFALVDCADYAPESLPKLLAEVKTRLARPCAHYPRLLFRRLEVGLTVIANPIGNDIEIAYSRAFKDAAKKIIAPPPLGNEQAGGLVALLAQIGPQIALAGAVAASVVQRRYPSLYEFYKWYGHRDRGERHMPETLLGELNNWAHPPGEHAVPDRAQRDRLLIEALLADLRHAYGRGRLAGRNWYRAVVLLRRSDGETGRLLLEQLEQVLRELRGAQIPPPPVLVVADRRSAA
ncbi:hypothetical protein [Glycomyces paridis]|uniref:Uncharacterized protein n=1 Tax=Glycomyces paridis TaxID=2126555 RepID=A0A4S8NYM8_9ACTN|nr:hypothetical protein [Glycomyces paridis]THV22843.1 hypothetical protein E9998_23405 [Glycomyces paridis]